MKNKIASFAVIAALMLAPLDGLQAAMINPAVDNSGCTATGQPFVYNSGTGAGQCPSGGQIASMGGGRAPSTIWVPTAAVTIGTTSETSVFSATGQGPGQTITGGVPYVGNEFHLHAAGVVTTPIGGGTVTLKVKWGTVAVATLSSGTLAISLTNQPWTIDASCTIRSISASVSSSTMVCSGFFIGATAVGVAFGSVAAVSVDTTANQVLDISWTWGTVTTQTVTVNDSVVEIKY